MDEVEVAVGEEQRALVVDGPAAQAADVCRRLLRSDDSAQRVETARLVLDRLRAGGGASDSADEVNTLLRLLSNYVAPTRALTEEALSLLHFSEHRVLTYQSKECVKLVIDAYLELLASDRTMLVPILGSLADMPLDSHDKSEVIDATQMLLDAAAEEDVPAVVQSLLSMATASTAPKVASRLRAECARVRPDTLRLTIEVVGRFATARSAAIKAFLHLIRQADALTPFDIILLTFLIGRSAENEAAVRAASSAAQSGSVHASVMRAAAETLLLPEWSALLPSFVRLCSCFLAACFHSRVKPSTAADLIAVAVRSLVATIDARSLVREEALTLLLAIVSHPPKLLLFANSSASMRSRGFLAWKVAEEIAAQLATLATLNPRALAPYSHLFLDHLHGISASPSEYGGDRSEAFPTHILDTLCSTMALLTKQERGVYSLVMITIQKQLAARPGGPAVAAFTSLSTCPPGPAASAADLRQLMAVFLSGYLLKHGVVVEPRDRKSLASWMLRLLSAASRDETLLHVIRFVRDEMLRGGSGLGAESSSTRALFCSSMTQVFQKKGFAVLSRARALQRASEGLCIRPEMCPAAAPEDDADAADAALVVDVAAYVSKMRLGAAASFGPRDAAGQASRQRESTIKMLLLRELFRSQLTLCEPEERQRMLAAGFAFPSALEAAAASSKSGALGPSALSAVIWSLACALDVCVEATNSLARLSAPESGESTRPEAALAAMRVRLVECFRLHDQLARMLAVQRFKVHSLLEALPKSDDSAASSGQRVASQRRELELLLEDAAAVEQMAGGAARPIRGEQPYASLFGLSLRVVCLAFQDQWKQSGPALPLAHELVLLRALQRHLQPGSAAVSHAGVGRGDGAGAATNAAGRSTEATVDSLVARVEGRRTLKYLVARAEALSRGVANSLFSHGGRAAASGQDESESESESESDEEARDGEATAAAIIHELMVRGLESIHGSLRAALDECATTDPRRRAGRDRLIAALAAGSSPQRPRAPAASAANVQRELLFRHLARQCLLVTDASLSCAGVDLVAALVQSTKKERYVSQLCLALLCQSLRPRGASAAASTAADAGGKLTADGLPVGPLPHAVVAPRGGAQVSLAKYRCASARWRHCAHLVVGVWAFAPSAALGSLLLLRLVEEARALVASTAARRPRKRRRVRAHEEEEEDEDEDEDDDEDYVEPKLMAPTGEHQVLKSLTTDSLPVVLDAVLLCAVASLFRAAPGGRAAARGGDPFEALALAVDVLASALRALVAAERAGLTMPVRTNQLALRASAFATRSLRGALAKCAAWRVRRRVDDAAGDVAHLWTLFDRVSRALAAADAVLASFQERVMLKMQRETAAIGVRSRSRLEDAGEDEDEGEGGAAARRRTEPGGSSTRWRSGLLAQALGGEFRPRRSIAKGEAALLPHLAHSVQELRDFLDEQRSVHNCDPERRASARAARPPGYAAVGRLALGSDEFVRFCRDEPVEDLLASGVLADWAPAARELSDDEDEDGESEEEENEDEVDEEEEDDAEGDADDA